MALLPYNAFESLAFKTKILWNNTAIKHDLWKSCWTEQVYSLQFNIFPFLFDIRTPKITAQKNVGPPTEFSYIRVKIYVREPRRRPADDRSASVHQCYFWVSTYISTDFSPRLHISESERRHCWSWGCVNSMFQELHDLLIRDTHPTGVTFVKVDVNPSVV